MAQTHTNQQICRARHAALRRLKDRYKAEYEALYREELGTPPLDCRVCGAMLPLGSRKTCGATFCVEAWLVLRRVGDAEIRTAANIANAQRMLTKSNDPAQRRYARSVIDNAGSLDRRGRWIVPHTRTAIIAKQCIDRGLPIADELPPEIRAQLLEEAC